ncbi:MAG: hypothetical protein GY715_21780, partial [Planctomycetes bacterium]|nr:hypothetical protein [Planctomycetota bacterium]
LCFLHIGWEARGTGWARGVTEEQWAVFEVNLTEAVTHLSRAWEIDPTCPEPAVAMMSIGRAGHLPPDEDMWLWFERARAAQFDWMPAYDQMLERLRPRWGGSLDEMYAFGMACMNTERYDTMVPFMLVTTIVDIGTDAESFSFLEDPGIYPSAREVVDRYVERPDRSGVRGWFASTGAAIAWAAGQHEDCLRYLELVEFKPFTSRLKVFDTTPREVIDDAVLYGSRIGPAVLRAEEAIDAGDVAAGMRGYEEALEVAGDDERIAGIVRDRIVATELLRGFMAGDWVPLRFRPGLPGWRVVEGVWQEISETAILAGPNSDGLKLLCLTPFGRRFEMRGVIDLRGLEKARGRRLNAGVYFAYAPERTRYTWQTLLLYRPSDWSQVGPRLDWRRAERFQLPRKKHHRYEFHLQVWDSEVIVTVDGEVVCTGTLGDDGEDRPLGDLIGLGGAYAEMCGFARFEDFAIRRLAGRPETTGTDP